MKKIFVASFLSLGLFALNSYGIENHQFGSPGTINVVLDGPGTPTFIVNGFYGDVANGEWYVDSSHRQTSEVRWPLYVDPTFNGEYFSEGESRKVKCNVWMDGSLEGSYIWQVSVPPAPPAAPSGVSASDGTYTDKVKVSWDSASGATSYEVWRGTSSNSGSSSIIKSTTSTYYYDTTATQGTTYYYWVKSINVGGSSISSYNTGYRQVSPPSAPSGVSASDGTYTDKVKISWNSRSGATSYEVWRGTSSSSSSASRIQSSTTSIYYNDTSATPGTTYYYWVKSKNSGGTSGFSSYNTGYRQVSPPSAPSGVSASNGTYTDKVRVSWDSAGGATSYEVWRGASSSSASSSIIKSTTSTAYDDTSAVAGTTYYYWVKSINAGGSSISSYSTGYRQVSPPSAPSGVSASDGTYTDKVRVSWGSASGATSYEVWRDTSSSSGSAARIKTGASSPYDDASAVVGITYYYWVKALNAGGTSAFSSYNTGYRKAAVASVAVKVNDQNGEPKQGVIVQPDNTENKEKYTGSSGTTPSWTDFSVGSHRFTAYFEGENPFDSDGEYWDSASVNLVGGANNTIILQRKWPYVESHKVFRTDTNQEITRDDVPPGVNVRVEVTVRNKLSVPRNVRLMVWGDRNKSPFGSGSVDIKKDVVEQTVPANGTKTYSTTISSSELSEDSYYLAFYTETYSPDSGDWMKTDSWNWSSSADFRVIVPTGTVSFSVYDTFSGDSVVSDLKVYDEDWGNRTDHVTLAGSALTIGLNAGLHYFEVEKDGNYWGWDSVTVTANSGAAVPFTRNAPAFTSLAVQDQSGNSLVENSNGRYEVAPGQVLRVTVDLKHELDAEKSVRTTVALDSSLSGSIYNFPSLVSSNTTATKIYNLTVPASASTGSVLQPYFKLDCVVNQASGWKRTDYTESDAFDLEVKAITYPTVASIDPVDGAEDVPVNSIIYIDFSEPMNESSVEAAGAVVLKKSDGSTVAGTLDYLSGIGSVRAEFISDEDLYAPETYTLTIKGGASGVEDVEGQAMQVDYSSSFTTADGVSQSTITFAGKTWNVKSGEGGPGPNKWSNSDKSVWVDNEGKLHLKIRKINGAWVCSEIWSQESFGYGRYTYKVDTNVEDLDKNTVVGLFTYLDDENEIDIEFSRWGDDANPAGNYVVQPSWIDGVKVEGNHEPFTLGLSGDYSTHSFVWEPDQIFYEGWHGHADGIGLFTKIHDWPYLNSQYVPKAGNEKVHLNFWLLEGLDPSDGMEAEVVISDFDFLPAEQIVSSSRVKSVEWDSSGSIVTCAVDLQIATAGEYQIIGYWNDFPTLHKWEFPVNTYSQGDKSTNLGFEGFPSGEFVRKIRFQLIEKSGLFDPSSHTDSFVIRDVEFVNQDALVEIEITNEDAQSVLNRFAPVLKTDYVVTDGEHIKDRCPKSIDSVLGDAQLVLSDQTMIASPSVADLLNNNHSGSVIDFRDPFTASDNAQWAGFIESLDNAIYGRLVFDEFDGENVIIAQYWLPYYASFMKRVIPWINSPWANYHEGETENISVVLATRNGVLTPISAFYAKHYKGDTVQWENVRKYGDEDGVTDHPIVYVSLGSHASFFSPEFPEDTFSDESERHYHQGRGNWYGKSIGNEAFGSVKMFQDSDAWLRFSGSWGDVPSYPFVKYSWADFGASGLYRWIHPGAECEKWISNADLSYDYSADPLEFSYESMTKDGANIIYSMPSVSSSGDLPDRIRIYYKSSDDSWELCLDYTPIDTIPVSMSVPSFETVVELFVCDMHDTGDLDPETGQHNPGTFEYFRSVTTNISIVHLLGPQTPETLTPADDAELQTLTPVLGWSAFVDGGDGDTQVGFEIRIRDSSTDDEVHSEVVASTSDRDYQVPSGKLVWGQRYHWHVRYQDSGGQWSAWSADTPETHQNFRTVQPGTFVIYSDHGSPAPAVGSYSYTSGAEMPGGSVVSPTVGSGGRRYRCFGYAGTGDAPSGSELSYAAFTINQDSTLTWEWIAQYEATSSAGVNGAISPSGSTWGDTGANIDYVATPNSGYQVDRWEVAGSEVQQGSTSYTFPDLSQSSSVVVYFSEIPINQYTLSFDSAGGTTVDTIIQESGTTVTPPAAPTQTGYTFAGWSPAVPATMPAENLTYTAQWTINQYTLTFDSAGGSAVDSITQDYGTTVTPPSDPTRSGYTFTAWVPAVPSTMPAESLTLTAMYNYAALVGVFESSGFPGASLGQWIFLDDGTFGSTFYEESTSISLGTYVYDGSTLTLNFDKSTNPNLQGTVESIPNVSINSGDLIFEDGGDTFFFVSNAGNLSDASGLWEGVDPDGNPALTELTQDGAWISGNISGSDFSRSYRVEGINLGGRLIYHVFWDEVSSDPELDFTGSVTGDNWVGTVLQGNDVWHGVGMVRQEPTDPDPEYNLIVIDGSGDGSYTNGASINIEADMAPNGQIFDGWSIVPIEYAGNIADTNAASTIVTMPATNMSITAHYSLVESNIYGGFALTQNKYLDSSDWDVAIESELGADYRVADWNDLVAYHNAGGDLLQVYDSLTLTNYRASASVTRSGDPSYSDTRYYFASRHEHSLPSGYWAHATIDSHLFDLGSWSGTRYVLAIKNAFDASIPYRAVTFDLGEHGSHVGGGSLTQQVAYGEAANVPWVRVADHWSIDGWDAEFASVTSTLTVTAQYTSLGLFEDSFENLDNWILWGSPSPAIYVKDGNSAFNNRGDANWDSGAVSKQSFDYSNGLVIEADAFQDRFGVWQSFVFGLSKKASYGSSDGAQMSVGIRARHDRGDTTQCSITYAGNQVEQFDLYDNNTTTWRHYRIVIRNDRKVEFYRSDELLYTTTNQLDLAYNNMPLVLGSRARYSPVLIDNVRVVGLGDSTVDVDGDNVPDIWEKRYFGGIDVADATVDADGDGYSNFAEYIAGMSPVDKDSCFKVAVATAASGGFNVQWTAIPGRVYDVLWTPRLDRGFQILKTGLTYPISSFVDIIHSPRSSGYYKIAVRLPGNGDVDGDGLPDSWESAYFSDTIVAEAAQDSDGDGQPNISEYIAGTNPTNPASLFQVSQGVTETGHIFVQWDAVTGRVYSVFYATDLFSNYNVLESDIEPPQHSYTDTVHNAESAGYYKVDVRLK